MTDKLKEIWWADVERDPTHLTAAEWLIRLQAPTVSLEETIEWQRWIRADQRHAEAFSRLERTYLEIGSVETPSLTGSPPAAADDYDGSTSIGEWNSNLSEQKRRQSWTYHSRLTAMAAGIVCVVLALGWFAFDGRLFSKGSPSSHALQLQTAIGENRTVTLTDGSRVILGGGSIIEVSFDTRARQVELTRGEAYFAVAKDTARPFAVQAGRATVTALGTEFNVRRRNDQVIVAVVEGRVNVESRLAAPVTWFKTPRSEQVTAGQETRVDEDGLKRAAAVSDSDAVTSWQAGRLVFHTEALRDVLEDVNRYSSKPIVVDDQSLADMRITGTMLRQDVRGWLESLEKAFGVKVEEESDRIVIRKR